MHYPSAKFGDDMFTQWLLFQCADAHTCTHMYIADKRPIPAAMVTSKQQSVMTLTSLLLPFFFFFVFFFFVIGTSSAVDFGHILA